MPLLASDVKLPNDLGSVFSGIGTNASNNISNNYNLARQKAASDATAQGFRGPLDYTTQRLGTTQGLDIGNLSSGLAGGLGDTAYKDTLSQRDYNQKMQLAEEAARLNKPSLLEQVFSGIGAVGKPIATYAGMGGFSGGGGGGASLGLTQPGLEEGSEFGLEEPDPTQAFGYNPYGNWRGF